MEEEDIKDIVSWGSIGLKVDNLIDYEDPIARDQSDLWDEYHDLLGKALLETVEKKQSTRWYYQQFVFIVRRFYEVTCKRSVEILQAESNRSVDSSKRGFLLGDMLEEVLSNEFGEFKDITDKYDPLVKEIRDLQVQVEAEKIVQKEKETVQKEKDRHEIKQRILISVVTFIITGVIGLILL